MALYRITTERGGQAVATVIRKQKPAAFQAFQSAVYDAVRSRAGLDTTWGRNRMAESESAAENTSRFIVMVQDVRVKFERLA